MARVIAREGQERRVDGIGQGDHLCLVYADDAEQRRVVTAYVRAGLSRGERVLYFADARAPREVLGWLRAEGVDPSTALTTGQLSVTTAAVGYLAFGAFDAHAVAQTLQAEVSDALSAGFTGLRVSGEMSWALRDVPGADQLGTYETAVNAVFAGQPASAICQYDARRFSAAALDDTQRRHPGTVELAPLHLNSRLRVTPSFRCGQRMLRVQGTVDHHTIAAFAATLETVLGWPGDVWVDLGELEFIDLAGLRALAQTAARLPAGRRMHLVELAPLLCQVVNLAEFDDISSLTVTARDAA
ncbi:MEDS domain-containing protein [Frankia sp. CNm7]|uniref:MEDS domain-containing protein n=1 Tax=Frankia nepalensis TaxID=1836974 RepID=A0A937RI50_9ACTN|nr:MEDS domain-containing protein [Frankia nepalensis]MBL7498436.1 MEDS domain-containing protein [Frankia nepalensis]MBL7512192.1 MEDS domain-containing protein [Frankia nepalensis]MBL7519477.1 MEDS domain-containing protein [Frankia nepalensis]MBL7629269.1 MEDS domain-containing protein [Frankia nepalensis]